MVLETIETEMGEETILIDGGNPNESKIISTPMSQHRRQQDFENLMVQEETRDDSPEDEHEEHHNVDETNVVERSVEQPMEESVEQSVEQPIEQSVEQSIEKHVVEQQNVTVAADATEIVEGRDERDFDKNPTVLFALLQKKEWKAVIERSHTHQDEAKVWVSRKEKDGRLRWRLLPIHAAIVFRAPEDVIETLLSAYPSGAQAKDDQGMLPLHLAFRNGSSEEIVHLLLLAFPQSIDVKDRKGRIPLILAQASNSPNKDLYLRALERGPAYYVIAAAENNRAAVIAEQRAIYDAKLMQVKQSHKHELATLQLEAENKQRELLNKIQDMEKELSRTQETSQVLVDHVNSLEAQLSSRSDTERFLATKIATLDTSLKLTEKERDETEQALKSENASLIAERDDYKNKFENIEKQFGQVQESLRASVELFEKRELEWSKNKKDLEQQVKVYQFDWANAQANCAILDAQLKKKMETEHALATQVSALAGKLAEAASDSREFSSKYSKKIKELEDERCMLRNSVQDLTKRLKLVASVLEDMTNEQKRIVEVSKTHDTVIVDALASHAKIVADAQLQQKFLEEARREREEMRKALAKQEEAIVLNEEKRTAILNAIAVQGQHMERTKCARDDLLESVKNMGNDVRAVLENILSVLPTNVEKEDEIVDAVVKNINCPVSDEDAIIATDKKEDKAAPKESTADEVMEDRAN